MNAATSGQGRKVGVIGLGSMGLGVARTLLGKGFTSCVRRSAEVAAGLRAQGREGLASPGRGRRQVRPWLIVLVVNAEQTDEVLFGAQWRGAGAWRAARW